MISRQFRDWFTKNISLAFSGGGGVKFKDFDFVFFRSFFVERQAAAMNLQHYMQRGQAIVLFALILPLIIVFAATIINVGNLYLHYTRLQNAADASVLAYASNYVQTENEEISEVFAKNIASMNLGNINYNASFSTNENVASVQLSTDMIVYLMVTDSKTTVTVTSSAQMLDSNGSSDVKLIQ